MGAYLSTDMKSDPIRRFVGRTTPRDHDRGVEPMSSFPTPSINSQSYNSCSTRPPPTGAPSSYSQSYNPHPMRPVQTTTRPAHTSSTTALRPAQTAAKPAAAPAARVAQAAAATRPAAPTARANMQTWRQSDMDSAFLESYDDEPTSNPYDGAFLEPYEYEPTTSPWDGAFVENFSRLSVNPQHQYNEYSSDDDYGQVNYNKNGTPVYTLSVTDQRVVVFEPAREKFIETNRSRLALRNIEKGEIYHASSITPDSIGGLELPSALRRDQYLFRHNFTYGSADTYRELILPALLLGSRVRDFEQRCAIVDQIGTFVLTMPPQNRRLKELTLKTITGTTFEIDVKFVKKGKEDDLDKKWIVTCHPPKQPLPTEVIKGAMLEIVGSNVTQPRVTAVLMRTYANKKASIDNWPLFSAIYGNRAKRDYPAVYPSSAPIYLAKNAGQVQLNHEQAEAVARYNCDVCPAFVVESPPGSGKTMTAAAMAVSYRGQGVQLFLSTANVPVINMALALAKLNIGTLRAIHFISSEREELMTEETRSPFSVLSLAKRNEAVKEAIDKLEGQIKFAPNEEEKDKLRTAIRKMCGHIYADKYDVYFSTVDMILGRLAKNPQGARKVDTIKQQLLSSVRRIVVDEASQLTESALNALILSFPKAQIVLVGDSKQLPPFRYTREDVVSELAARSALEVMKAKKNLPVIKLSHVYRASPLLMAHYSNVFYDGKLVSNKPESKQNLLSDFGARSGGNKCLFWKVKGHQKQAGTSKINDGEISCLKHIINILRGSGHDEKSVMIISYYEAQRKKVEDELPEGYEVLTVDSAQGREKKIVIVLTTRTSVPTESGAFFSCPLRCNVAVSRHQEALIVLGHNAIASAPNWARILSPKYFKHVEPFNDTEASRGENATRFSSDFVLVPFFHFSPLNKIFEAGWAIEIQWLSIAHQSMPLDAVSSLGDVTNTLSSQNNDIETLQFSNDIYRRLLLRPRGSLSTNRFALADQLLSLRS